MKLSWMAKPNRAANLSAVEADTDVALEALPKLVLPDGVDEIVCDRQAQQMGPLEVSAVVVGNRLLILPVSSSALDERMIRVEPDPSVFEALGMVASPASEHANDSRPEGTTPGNTNAPENTAPKETNASENTNAPVRPRRFPFRGRRVAAASHPTHPSLREIAPGSSDINDGNGTATGDGNGDATGDAIGQQLVSVDNSNETIDEVDSQPIQLARPLRQGEGRSPAAVELIGVVHDLPTESPSVGGTPSKQLYVDMQIAAGEYVSIVGAQKWSSRLLFSLIAGLESPREGIVLHRGVPVETAGVDKDRFDRALPGVLSPKMAVGQDMCAEDFVAFALLTYDVSPSRARLHARAALDEVGIRSLAGQPMSALSPLDRRCAGIARALVGPWPTRYLFDPLHGFDDERAELLRNCIALRTGRGDAMVILTDDPDLLRGANRVIGVSEGRLYEAVRRLR
jgi:predicted ABC-type transport system involved in lysophospholipase L1 biosynthesis ATPase subunit